jgi:hypothetical protein
MVADLAGDVAAALPIRSTTEQGYGMLCASFSKRWFVGNGGEFRRAKRTPLWVVLWGSNFLWAIVVARIFLSHSSANNADAVALRESRLRRF